MSGDRQSESVFSLSPATMSSAIVADTSNLHDVVFTVGEGKQIFPAHKLILSSASESFKIMFYGGSPPDPTPVEIPDVDPDGFRQMLKYVYCNEIHFESVDSAVSTLSVANKYSVTRLATKCLNYLRDRIDPTNACCLFEVGTLVGDCGLEIGALRIIQDNTEKILNSKVFLSAQESTVKHILCSDYLTISSESVLFDALLRWGKANCEQDYTSLVKPLLPYIRFLTMTPEEFATGPIKSGLFTDEEIFAVLVNIMIPDWRPLPPWCSAKRLRGNTELQVLNFVLCEPGSHGLFSTDLKKDSLSFKLCVKGKNVVVLGFGVVLNCAKIDEELNFSESTITAVITFSYGSDTILSESVTCVIGAKGLCLFLFNNPQIAMDGESYKVRIQFDKIIELSQCVRSYETILQHSTLSGMDCLIVEDGVDDDMVCPVHEVLFAAF